MYGLGGGPMTVDGALGWNCSRYASMVAARCCQSARCAGSSGTGPSRSTAHCGGAWTARSPSAATRASIAAARARACSAFGPTMSAGVRSTQLAPAAGVSGVRSFSRLSIRQCSRDGTVSTSSPKPRPTASAMSARVSWPRSSAAHSCRRTVLESSASSRSNISAPRASRNASRCLPRWCSVTRSSQTGAWAPMLSIHSSAPRRVADADCSPPTLSSTWPSTGNSSSSWAWSRATNARFSSRPRVRPTYSCSRLVALVTSV